MKRMVAVLLACGIVCTELLSQELPFVFHVSGQPTQREVEPAVIALGSRLAPSLFDLRSTLSDPSRWRGVRSREDLSLTEDRLRTVLMSYSSSPEVNDSELNSIKKQRLISGLLFATSWVATVVVDLCVQDGYRSTTVIPVVGPWMTLSRMARNHDRGWPGAKALGVASGVAQTAFAAWFIISLTRHPKPKGTKAVSLSAGLNTVNLRIQF